MEFAFLLKNLGDYSLSGEDSTNASIGHLKHSFEDRKLKLTPFQSDSWNFLKI
ncbi:MAG: hypothetical protein AAB443_02465 [Patescibacteria group bacterium]